jgi:hypothetical protein
MVERKAFNFIKTNSTIKDDDSIKSVLKNLSK